MEAQSSESDAASSRRLSRFPPTPSSFREEGEISEIQRRKSQNLQRMGDDQACSPFQTSSDQVIRSMMESVADMEGTTMNESSAESDKEIFSQLLAPFQTSDDLFAQVLEDSHESSDGGIVGMEDALMNLGNEHDHFTFDQHMASFANSPQLGLVGTPTSQPIFSPATSSGNGHRNKRLSTQAVSIPSCHSSSGYISSDTSCQCTATALRILETLAVHSKSGDLGTAEHTLYSLKGNIGKCQELAQCSVCGRESGICILLIMLCEKITSAFEEVASSWEHQLEGFRRNAHRGLEATRSSHGPLWHMDIDRIRVIIGEYQIDTVEERCEVFSALTLLQLNKLSTLMSELRSNALASSWESHLTLLRVTGQRVKALKEALRRMIGVATTSN
ncbi:hypothetical protein BGZ60DRAFT_413887 [Tricladium varicosporioides]|nr:hypothetical protein BGZ60DRAFT_413887 [Hymenoscyphus varicosporioides]